MRNTLEIFTFCHFVVCSKRLFGIIFKPYVRGLFASSKG